MAPAGRVRNHNPAGGAVSTLPRRLSQPVDKSMTVKKSNHFLFHCLLKQFQAEGIKSVHLLVAVSGGVDSLTLLSVLWELKHALGLTLSVVHVHHGATDKKQKAFQDRSARTVKKFYATLLKEKPSKVRPAGRAYRDATADSIWDKKAQSPVPVTEGKGVFYRAGAPCVGLFLFKCGQSPALRGKSNEASLRKNRYRMFKEGMKKSQADLLVLAHTADDLLETRLIRLIRGTGEQGLTAMSFKQGLLLRPFIVVHRSHILDYAKKRNLQWCEDPTNRSPEHSLRNWIRHKWLVQLQKKRPGAVAVLARSLELMARRARKRRNKIKKLCEEELIHNHSLRRDKMAGFSQADKKNILAFYLKAVGCTNYRAGHITELLKHIERPQKTFGFCLLGRTWKMTPQKLIPGDIK